MKARKNKMQSIVRRDNVRSEIAKEFIQIGRSLRNAEETVIRAYFVPLSNRFKKGMKIVRERAEELTTFMRINPPMRRAGQM